MYRPIAHLLLLIGLLQCWASARAIANINADESTMWSGSFLESVARDDDLNARDTGISGPPPCTYVTRLVGNGNPHINYHNKQVTNTVGGCDQKGITCTTTKTSGHTFSFSFDAGGSPSAGPLEWISGGFSVSKSWSSGLSEGCSASAPNKNVCEWFQKAYVRYDVETIPSSPLCGSAHSYRIWSPTNNNACGLGYYCVVNTCRSLNQGYWILDGPAGSSC